MEKSNGQKLLAVLEAWICSWVKFPTMVEGQGLIAALWCLHTWFAPKWPATAYVIITGEGPGCGKSTLLEVLASLSCNPEMRSTLRAPEVVRGITAVDGVCTYFFDEMEKLSASGASDMRSILTSGYKRGGIHSVTSGKESVKFSTYCAKAFASIGNLADVFESRSIVFRLAYGVAARNWTDAVMVREGEAKGLLELAKRVLDSNRPVWTAPEWLAGREREIWTPLYSVALALNLDATMMQRVRRAMDDLGQLKLTTESRSYRDLVQAKANKAEGREYAELALRDLARCMPCEGRKATGHLFSVGAVARMRELDGPWRVFGGAGLDVDRLAALVARFGLKPVQVREERGIKSQQLRGYRGDDVKRAMELLKGGA